MKTLILLYLMVRILQHIYTQKDTHKEYQINSSLNYAKT